MPPKGSDLIFDHRHNADERAFRLLNHALALILPAIGHSASLVAAGASDADLQSWNSRVFVWSATAGAPAWPGAGSQPG
jgi:hypothetical protein